MCPRCGGEVDIIGLTRRCSEERYESLFACIFCLKEEADMDEPK